MKQGSKIISEIKKLARRLFANNEASVYLYGSRARGNASSDSDWDLLIITDDGLDSDDNFANYAFPFAEIGWRYGAQITPLLYTRSQWQAESSTAFHLKVESEAIML